MYKQILACKSYFIQKKRILSVFVFCFFFVLLFLFVFFSQPNVMRKKLSEPVVFNEKCSYNLKIYYRLLIRTDGVGFFVWENIDPRNTLNELVPYLHRFNNLTNVCQCQMNFCCSSIISNHTTYKTWHSQLSQS